MEIPSIWVFTKLQQGLGEGALGWAPEKDSWDSHEDRISVGHQEAATGRTELKNTHGDPATRRQPTAATPASTNATPGDWTPKRCCPHPQVITTMLASRETEKSNQLGASTSLLFAPNWQN